MRVPLIAGNWKMNTNIDEALKLVKDIHQGLTSLENLEKVVCPPFISLAAVSNALKGTDLKVGAQNAYFEDQGAFTGEIAAAMLKDLCAFVILGHSERRQYFKETDEIVSKKIKAVIKHSLKPILCVGENLAEYEAGQTQQIVVNQIKNSLAGIDNIDSLTVAYEPIWAIGTGKAATGIQAQATIKLIRTQLASQYSRIAADKVRILYGGSVTSANIQEFVSQPDIDGGLVGGASLKPAEFLSIIAITSRVKAG
jgi:triosephosphate isomerase (TIM)